MTMTMSSNPVTQALSDVAVVVSGLPRSGTSLMMAMLQAGGVPPLTDGQRVPDDDNPNGYFELEAVKRLQADAAWLNEARGKAVKIVVPLVFQLPSNFRFRIIFMERSLDEVIASQAAMLQRKGRQPALPAEALKAAFERQLSRARTVLVPTPHQQTLFLNHRDVLANPNGAAAQVAAFLQTDLNLQAMAAVVDPALHRQRLG